MIILRISSSAKLPFLDSRKTVVCPASLGVAMKSWVFVEPSESSAATIPTSVIGDSQNVETGTDCPAHRADPPTSKLAIRNQQESSALRRWDSGSRTREQSRGLGRSACCGERNATHDFGCLWLDKASLPLSFQTMLKTLSHVLGYLFIADALLTLSHRTREKLHIRRILPEFTHLMQMGLGWNVRNVRPFVELFLRDYGLHRQVFCGADQTGQDGVDFVIALEQTSERVNPKGSPAPQTAYKESIPMCPVVVQRSVQDNPIARLRAWLSKHSAWLEANNPIPNGACWPVPFFVVDNDKWKLGFAVQSVCGFRLYEEFVGSMGWQNGVRKIVVILKLVIESTIQRHQLFCDKTSRNNPSDDEDWCLL